MDTEANPPRWTLLSLRPRGQHAPMRRAARALGGATIALSPWALRARTDTATRTALDAALGADRVIFSSPAAVVAAARLARLDVPHPGQWLAVGSGTAAALHRAGAHDIQAPARMDSEGLLALPALAALDGLRAGLVTAPGGRGIIAATLQARGAQLLRADVYLRQPLPLPARALQRLRHAARPWAVAVSSADALARLLAHLPDDLQSPLRQACVVAASERLAAQAVAAGFGHVVQAEGPLPAQLVQAAHAALTPRATC
ncbi:uroporphyrinogen-III synthase [Stenotrophomonas sp. LGBM10]|uniref:uroporphyrinogen-III synthase n=1 Tax=Stenotrophomonas sp. LGBM10 TaxID=3390038 RepID=UPI00398A7424